ncbi:MAG: hypothetical protein KF862_18330 [Chitinophagaceae bacterium]|nr:hypothetical protein [Chitinophagaceae bacterium]
MDEVIKSLIERIESVNDETSMRALSDLRLVVERFTMNRYEEKEESDYRILFYDKTLIDYRLKEDDYDNIKYFLFYILLNLPGKAFFIAKCIKVLYDETANEAICSAVEVFLRKNDEVTYELLLALIDQDQSEIRFVNQRIVALYNKVLNQGGKLSKDLVINDLNYKELPR